VHNLKNHRVIKNLDTDPHIYVMKDGTFEFEDEQGILTDNHYPSFVDAKKAFIEYADELFGISEEREQREEKSRREALAAALTGIRSAIGLLIYTPENAKFHATTTYANHNAGGIMDHLAEYIDSLTGKATDKKEIPF
jgi:hypothetical protein